jgi:hypothetical protein
MIRVYAVPGTATERAELLERGWRPTRGEAMADPRQADPELIQIVVLPHIQPALEQWLAAHGMMLFRLPAEAQDPDDLPTYGIAPTAEAMVRFLAAQGDLPMPEDPGDDTVEQAELRGHAEGADDVGVTYDDSSTSARSVAYDEGRARRRRELGREP